MAEFAATPLAEADWSLHPDEICVWSASLDEPAGIPGQLAALLAFDERERAACFHFARDRDRYTVARARLRILLAGYLQCAPEALKFSYGPRGKPELARPQSDVCFNVSHSHELALYAIGRGRALGVDIEWMRDGVAESGVAERFFAADEVAALHKLPIAQRRSGFFACWTRKEAYLKARGDGIAVELDSFSVSLEPGGQAQLRRGEQIERWRLAALEPASGYQAALCAEGGDWRMRCFHWPS